MVSRPTDWLVVGWDCDPTPGDPVVIRAGGEHYRDVAGQLGRVAGVLRVLDAGSSSGSQSVTALLEGTSELAERLETAAVRYQVAGDALVDYAFTLDRIQASTAQALVVAKAAKAEADECRRLAKLYRRYANEATDPEEKARYVRLETRKLGEERDAEARVSAQETVMSQGATDQLVAGDEAAALIEQVTSTDGLNDSWQDDLLSALLVFSKVMEVVSAILGILALVLCWVPILGQALMVIAAIAGIITALANIVLAASGEISWTEAIISIGFAVLGCLGLGGLRGAFTALRAGGRLLTSGKALAGVFKAGAVAVKAGVKASLAGLASRLGNAATRLRGGGRGATRGGGIIEQTATNAAGGRIFTSTGNIQQGDFGHIILAASMKGEDVHVISGAHGFDAGTFEAAPEFFRVDCEKFRGPGVTVHDLPAMSVAEVQAVLESPGVVIGGFCHSGICLRKLVPSLSGGVGIW